MSESKERKSSTSEDDKRAVMVHPSIRFCLRYTDRSQFYYFLHYDAAVRNYCLTALDGLPRFWKFNAKQLSEELSVSCQETKTGKIDVLRSSIELVLPMSLVAHKEDVKERVWNLCEQLEKKLATTGTIDQQLVYDLLLSLLLFK